jgi:hypothetical protein
MHMKQIYVLLILLLFSNCYGVNAQTAPDIKWGKVSVENFSLEGRSFDTSVNAVIIAEVGDSQFEGNLKGWFSIRHKVKRRIKILRKPGFDAATIVVPLFISGNSEERIADLKASAYSLENGQVIETKMDKASVFEDKFSKNFRLRKFAVPGVKEGSIIEYSYTLISDFLFNLQPWDFQSEYPVLWSEYNVTIPEYFKYVKLSKGYQPFFIQKETEGNEIFNISLSGGSGATQHVTLKAKTYITRFVVKDVPPIKEEPFTSTLANHRMHIEFQLAMIQLPETVAQDIMGSWAKLSKEMMERESFGLSLNKNNAFLSDDLKTVLAGTKTKTEKAHKLFEYVRDNFTCTNPGGIYLSKSLKDIFKTKSGTGAELNLLLTAMLMHEGIKAYPVILSTRQHGETLDLYPLLDKFNYTAVAMADENTGGFYFMDASKPNMGFNHFSEDLYNGHARILTEETMPIYLDADSLIEANKTFILLNADSNKLSGSYAKDYGYFSSTKLRENLKKIGNDGYLKDLQKANGDMKPSNLQIDSLKDYDNPVKLTFDFKFKDLDEDVLYINPIISENIKDNPFKADSRNYPIEMPYRRDDLYIFNMSIPEGYQVEEMPKSTRVMLNENQGMYEYLIGKSGNLIQLKARLVIGKATFPAEDYQTLREFFSYVVKKQSEQIVLKKIK